MTLKPVLSGLIDRLSTGTSAIPVVWYPYLDGIVAQVNWSDLQPAKNGAVTGTGSGTSATGTNYINYIISFAQTNLPNARVRIRINAGPNSPGWLGTQLGTVGIANKNDSWWVSGTSYTVGNLAFSPSNGNRYICTSNVSGSTDPSSDASHWSLNNPSQIQSGLCPIWWSTTRDNNSTANPYNGNSTSGWLYSDYWNDLMTKLAAVYDSNAMVADVTMSGTTTSFSENSDRHCQGNSNYNPTSINCHNLGVATGLGGAGDVYTTNADIVAVEACQATMTAWATTRTYIAYIPMNYGVATTVGSGSGAGSAANNPAGWSTPHTLSIVSSTGFSANNQLCVVTSAGANFYTYTGSTGGGSPTFTGVNFSSGAGGTLANGNQVMQGRQSTPSTWSIVAHAVATLGDQAVIGNNGFEFDANGDFSVPTCRTTAAYRGPVSYQTRTASQLADLSVNMLSAAGFGAMAIEMPDSNNSSDQGYQNWNPTDPRITAGRAALKANAALYAAGNAAGTRNINGVPPQLVPGVS